MVRISLLLLFLIQFSQSYCQTLIRGKVTAPSSIPAGIRVNLVAENGSGGSHYSFTDAKGMFLFSGISHGNYTLLFQSLAYKSLSRSIHLNSDTLELSIELEESSIQLQEVYVAPKKFIRAGRDTIELDAKNYLQGEERTVEDLLRKIPGIQISENGTIKVGNKEIEKVMVEGDDLFGKGYKLLTQNLTVHPIEKVQVLQRYSNNKHLKGVEHSEKIALNLTLKSESKSQWVGSIDAAASVIPIEFYNAQANLMNFGKKTKYYLLGSANNNGLETLRGIDHLILSQDPNEPGQVGLQVSTPSLLENKPSLNEFDPQRSNFNNDKLLSFNGIFSPRKDLKIKWLGFGNSKKNSFVRRSLSEYAIEDVKFTNHEDLHYTNSDINYFSKIELQYDPSKNSTITYIGTLGNIKANDIGELIFNGIGSLETIKKRSLLSNHLLSYTQKLAERTVLVSSFRWIRQRSPINYAVDQYLYGDLFEAEGIKADSIKNVWQDTENNVDYYGMITELVKRDAKGNPFSASIAHEITLRGFNSAFYLMNGSGETYRPNDFFNRLNFEEHNTALSAQYTWKSRRLELTPSITARLLHSTLQDKLALQAQSSINKLWSPKATVLWRTHSKGELRSEVSYQMNMSQSALDVLPNFVYKGNRTFSSGLKENPILDIFSVNAVYTLGKMTDKLYTILSGGYSQQFDYIGQQQELNPDYNRNNLVLFKNRTLTYFNAQLNYFVAGIKGNIRLTGDGQLANYQTQIKGLPPLPIQTAVYQLSLDYRSVWESPINIFTGLQFYNSILRNGSTRSVVQSKFEANINARLSKKIRTSLKNDLYRFEKGQYSPSQYYLFSDFSLQYFILKKMQLELTAKNIFNVDTFTQSVLSDSHQSTQSYALRPRQVMFGINLSF